MLVIACPGQGSQTPGFLRPWLEVPGFEDRLRWLSAVAGIDLVAHGTESDADTIRDTAVAQPLIVASGMVSLLALFPHPAEAFRQVAAGAGHSVGEITAAAGAGVLSAEQAMVFVRERGKAMAAASAVTPTGMTAVLGGDPDDVAAALQRHGLTPANANGAGQVVAAGTLEQLAALKDDPPAKARLIPLQVAGAFHTDHMRPAVDVLSGYARAMTTHDPRTRLLSNADGHVVHDGREVLNRLVRQVSNPVRWDLCMDAMRDLGVTGVIEIPPAGALTGLVKRALPGVETLALKTPDDLDAARDMVARHGQESGLSQNPTWRLVVAPIKGTVHFTALDAGASVDNGQTVARVATLRDEYDVVAPHGGRVVEWLVEDGDPVSPGQPIVRLHPQEVPA
ncbi:acyltransferase domain-containing protein [Angustibacter sp. Root456]|uniref:acyltransferase domain-containing protein n=1 Tax=Angustibacter sp. Root456 TaxID=1736539 RepID=UPI0007013EED|nr:acyltransferase domain-containing protein [Angustibacter sp. Root456]KQX67210.1 biotin attachment protein [Angustibacter sp. Root456]